MNDFCSKAVHFDAGGRLPSTPLWRAYHTERGVFMEYAKLISQILSAEENARSITREVQEKQAALEEELRQEKEAIHAAYLERAAKKVESIRAEAERRSQRELEAQDQRLHSLVERIERAYQKYGDNWVNTLFHQIVGDET